VAIGDEDDSLSKYFGFAFMIRDDLALLLGRTNALGDCRKIVIQITAGKEEIVITEP